ncbi:unnamed protein product [Euphydryas editha]|uniref:Uncharacterized protein n=1 Tax=Euphydryas editha TaxID=104508 RepID=A0AAU9TWY4_EUPED|nr:unnamed protein product [Euphydryas editha]
MSPHWEGSLTFSKYLDYLQNICDNKQDHSRCAAIMLQLHHGYEQLSHYNNVMMNEHTMRTRRSYNDNLILNKRAQSRASRRILEKSQIVEAELNVLKRYEQATQAHQPTIKSAEQQLYAVKKESFANNHFILSAIIANNIFSHLKDTQNILLDTMTNIYNCQLSLHLLTPDQLHQELNTIAKISRDLSLPFENISLPNIYLNGKR